MRENETESMDARQDRKTREGLCRRRALYRGRKASKDRDTGEWTMAGLNGENPKHFATLEALSST